MPGHQHSVGTPVIFLDTWEHGTISQLLPPIAGIHRYNTNAHGRPATPGQGQGNGRSRNNVNEDILRPGMSTTRKIRSDNALLDWVRTLSVAVRTTLKTQKISERDNSGSTDHAVAEAIRYFEAITTVEGE